MKLPFVSRTIHEDMVRDLREQLAKEQKRSRRLERTVIDMKVAGGSIPRTADGLRLERRPPTAIETAIAENPRAAVDPALRRHLGTWAAKEMGKEGADEKAIIERLRTWNMVAVERDDDDDAEDDELIAI